MPTRTARPRTATVPEPDDLAEKVTDPAVSDEIALLVVRGIDEVARGKISLGDLFATLHGGLALATEPDKTPPVPRPLTEAQRAALDRLPDVYGRVVVTADRVLSKKEQAALVEEREVIDLLLAPLKQRKEESIREVLANHLDNLVDPEAEPVALRKDAKGHWAKKQEVPVEGTGKKIQRSVSGGKPVLSIEHVQKLHEDGLIDRSTYLAITRRPDVPRVLDEAGLHQAIQKDPRLFFLLGSVAEQTTPTTTIKVVADTK